MNRPDQPLKNVRILSLALNLPGPAALMRCHRMGAACTKLEPPSGDPMGHYSAAAYAELHEGVKVVSADLKSEVGQQFLHPGLQRGLFGAGTLLLILLLLARFVQLFP